MGQTNTNEEYLNKADLVVADLVSNGGYLSTEQAKQFFEIVILESVLLPQVQTIPMNAPTYEIPKAAFLSRVLRPATENRALPVTDRSKPDFGKTILTSHELIADVSIPYGVVEDNIQNGTFMALVMKLLGGAVARDIEELAIQGDTASADTYLAVLDGILKQAVSYVYNAGGVRLSKSVLKTLLQTIPSQFRKNMAIFTSENAIVDYNDSLSNRQTPLGDEALTKGARGEYNGMPMFPIPLFPENIGTSSNKTNVIMTNPKNIAVGMQRDIRIESTRDIRSRQFIVVATLRVDVKYVHEPAVGKATEVLAIAG